MTQTGRFVHNPARGGAVLEIDAFIPGGAPDDTLPRVRIEPSGENSAAVRVFSERNELATLYTNDDGLGRLILRSEVIDNTRRDHWLAWLGCERVAPAAWQASGYLRLRASHAEANAELVRIGGRGSAAIDSRILHGEVRVYGSRPPLLGGDTPRDTGTRAHLYARGSDNDGGSRGRLELNDESGATLIRAGMEGPDGEPSPEIAVLGVGEGAFRGGFTPLKASLGIDRDGNTGFLEVHGLNRNHMPATIRIDADGLHGDPGKELNFVLQHPTDPSREIYYCVPEGPEAGVYVRGTLGLDGGSARVQLPGHFALVASEGSLTAHLTPRSAESKGVAAVSLSATHLEVRELFGGRGSYAVDYLVQGVRRGKEGYEVERPKCGRRRGP